MIHLFTRAATKFKPKLNRHITLIGCVKHLCKAALKLKHSTIPLCTGLVLPSWLEIITKVSEKFIRLNSLDSRWAPLGRVMMRHYFPPNMDGAAALSVAGRRGARKLRTVQFIMNQLQWSRYLHPADGPHSI